MEGRNFAELQGVITYPKMSTTQAGTARYQASLSIPVTYEGYDGQMKTTNSFVPITAWGEIAESMEVLEEGAAVKVHGRINIRNYDSTCRECNAAMKRKWAEVVVDNFMEL